MFDQLSASKLANVLVTDIRDFLKKGAEDFKIPRYKLVVQCVIGEMNGQGIRIMSQCLWDEQLDNYADCTITKVYWRSHRITITAR